MAYIYESFECVLRLQMGILLATHIVTSTDASPYFRELAEIIPDASVQIMLLGFG